MNDLPASPVGVVGLGLLGTAIAERLLAAGIPVLGYDIDSDRRAAFASLGGRGAVDVGEVAAAVPRLLLSLPTTDVVEAVLTEIAPALRPGAIVADTTTGDPVRQRKIAARLAERGIHYLDACVSGSSEDARRGQAVVIAGGAAESFAACRDLFAAFARRAFHVGPPGSGAALKLVTNLVLGLNRAALAEGLALAGAQGIDPSDALAVLCESAAHSRAMDAKGAKMVARDFTPQARLAQHLKDVRLILSAAQSAGQPLPFSTLHERLLAELANAGYGGEDNSAILRAFDREP